MAETLAIRVARALRRARLARGTGLAGNSGSRVGQDGGEQPPDEADIACARAAIEACFDDVWSDGYLIGAKYGASGIGPELLRSVAKEQILDRVQAMGDGAEVAAGRLAANPMERAEAALRHIVEQSKNRRS